MHILRITLLIVFNLFTLGYSCPCEESETETGIQALQKIYVSPEQIAISQEEIFYVNELGELRPVHVLSSDTTGLFIVPLSVYICPVCLKTNRDNMCRNKECPLYNR